MILVPVREDNPDQILATLLDKFEIWQDEINAGIVRACESQAEINHQPFTITTI